MNIIVDNTTGEVLAENVPNYKLGIVFNELCKKGYPYETLQTIKMDE